MNLLSMFEEIFLPNAKGRSPAFIIELSGGLQGQEPVMFLRLEPIAREGNIVTFSARLSEQSSAEFYLGQRIFHLLIDESTRLVDIFRVALSKFATE